VADTRVTVIGAGVVGLAVAARLAAKVDVVVLERGSRHGLETSSRNSEVIHAGLYYPKDSLKTRLCLRGNRLLYDLCTRKGIGHRRIGKVITAVSTPELPALHALFKRGEENGVELEVLSAAQARRMEPRIVSEGALFSPSTGIVSAHGLMDFFLHEAREQGAIVQFRTSLEAIDKNGGDYTLSVRQGDSLEKLTTESVVNAAGLDSDRVAGMVGIDVEQAGYRLHYCKGSYFALRPGLSGLVSHLVYPLPSASSLGLHAVLDLSGRVRFGPDLEYLASRRQDYSVPDAGRAAFGRSVRRIAPEVKDEDLTPDIAGIRPKLQGPGEGFRDFVIHDEKERGFPGFINLVGIDSPGLTASPAIAEEVDVLLGY
jgi:L-2-hydroxyglutarate oxidase LhgO